MRVVSCVGVSLSLFTLYPILPLSLSLGMISQLVAAVCHQGPTFSVKECFPLPGTTTS